VADSVSSENSAVETVRAELTSAGATGRPRITVPESAHDRFPTGELVTLVLDGTRRHARIDLAIDDSVELRGAYDTRAMARNGDGENRLVEWADRAGLGVGRSVLLDVVSTGELYGVRAPGKQAVYEVPDTPASSLRDIAESVDGDDA
jgi:hypothetical protein